MIFTEDKTHPYSTPYGKTYDRRPCKREWNHQNAKKQRQAANNHLQYAQNAYLFHGNTKLLNWYHICRLYTGVKSGNWYSYILHLLSLSLLLVLHGSDFDLMAKI